MLILIVKTSLFLFLSDATGFICSYFVIRSRIWSPEGFSGVPDDYKKSQLTRKGSSQTFVGRWSWGIWFFYLYFYAVSTTISTQHQTTSATTIMVEAEVVLAVYINVKMSSLR